MNAREFDAELTRVVASGMVGHDFDPVDRKAMEFRLGLNEKEVGLFTSKSEADGGMPRIILGGKMLFILPHVRAWLMMRMGAGECVGYGVRTGGAAQQMLADRSLRRPKQAQAGSAAG